MELQLTEAQAALLRDVLDSVLRDLNYEIADTDTSSFRESLRERREGIRAILAQVGGSLSDTG